MEHCDMFFIWVFSEVIFLVTFCDKYLPWLFFSFPCALFPSDYPHGITILSPFGSDKKQVLNFCAQSAEELLKFVEDLKESIAEVSEMEQIRIECKLFSETLHSSSHSLIYLFIFLHSHWINHVLLLLF